MYCIYTLLSYWNNMQVILSLLVHGVYYQISVIVSDVLYRASTGRSSPLGFSITFSTWYWEIAWVSMLLSKVDWICSCLVHQLQVVPQQRFYSSVGKHGVGLTCACMGMSSTSDGPAVDTNLTASGEIRIVPDLSTKCRLPWYCLTSISAWEIHSFLYPFEF